MTEVSFKDWQNLDIRVAEILDVQDHPNADKLYVIKINLGEEERTIVAGIKGSYTKEELKGKKLNLRQLNAYRNVLKGNQEGLEQLQGLIKDETKVVQGTYASLKSLKQEFERLKDRTERAKKADQKLHKSLPKVDKLMTELAKKLYPGGQ